MKPILSTPQCFNIPMLLLIIGVNCGELLSEYQILLIDCGKARPMLYDKYWLIPAFRLTTLYPLYKNVNGFIAFCLVLLISYPFCIAFVEFVKYIYHYAWCPSTIGVSTRHMGKPTIAKAEQNTAKHKPCAKLLELMQIQMVYDTKLASMSGELQQWASCKCLGSCNRVQVYSFQFSCLRPYAVMSFAVYVRP